MISAPKNPVPVFPLPGVMLFPYAILQLHVFELRYRTMVRDALSGERLIVMALLKPGWERDYYGSPEFFPVGCLARFEEVEWLVNDCYDLKLTGTVRVRLSRIAREFPYRAARVEPVPQAPLTEDDPLVTLEKRALGDACARLVREAQDEWETLPELSGDAGYEALVNRVCMALRSNPLEKQSLLELDSVLERGRQAREMVERRLQRPARRTPGGGEHN